MKIKKRNKKKVYKNIIEVTQTEPQNTASSPFHTNSVINSDI